MYTIHPSSQLVERANEWCVDIRMRMRACEDGRSTWGRVCAHAVEQCLGSFLIVSSPMVLQHNKSNRARQLGAEANVHYIFANATVSLRQLLSTYPGPVEVRVCCV